MTFLSTAGSAALALIVTAAPAAASPLGELGGKLLLTRGVTAVDGATGGGLSTWALIAGNGTEDGVGASAFVTRVDIKDYELTAYGGAVGLYDRLELSYARHEFDTGDTGALLGLGKGFTFGQDIYGAKLRLVGDAVYDQDKLLPQIAVGVQHKIADQSAVIGAVGGESDEGTDVYVAATKLLLDKSLLVNATVRFTEANQFGLLGFGGDREDGHTAQLELSAAAMLSERLIVGAEVRTKPDNLGFAREDEAFDIFGAYALNHNATVVAGFADLGSIATRDGQRGLYLSLQFGF